MKLIQQYDSEVDAKDARDNLRKRGVLTYISSRQSYSLSGVVTGAFKVGLWVIIDNQYQDACNILTKKSFKVRFPLTEEQMLKIEISNKNNAPKAIIRVLFLMLGVLFVVVSGAVYIILG